MLSNPMVPRQGEWRNGSHSICLEMRWVPRSALAVTSSMPMIVALICQEQQP
jgi:hypothetical protein